MFLDAIHFPSTSATRVFEKENSRFRNSPAASGILTAVAFRALPYRMPPSVPKTWTGTASDLLPPDADGVIFDCDGTLVDTMPAHHAAFLIALAPYSVSITSSQFYALAGMPLEAILPLIASEQSLPVPPSDAVASAKTAAMAGAITPAIDCVAEVLKEARKRGLKVAVASGGRRENVLKCLVSAGILREGEGAGSVFDAVVCSEDVKKGKPNPEGFLKAAKEMGVNPEKCVGLEDADLGMQALEAAGMAAVDVRLHPRYPRQEA